VDLGEAEGQVVGFRTGVDEVADGELVGHGADDAPRAQDDVVVQEAVVRVQDGHLPAAGFDDGGVAVAHWTKKKKRSNLATNEWRRRKTCRETGGESRSVESNIREDSERIVQRRIRDVGFLFESFREEKDKREANSLHCIILEGKKSKIASIIRKIMNKIEMVYKFQKNLIVPEDKKENFLLRVSQYFSISLWLCVS
jgi:hypothetical protein